MVLLLRGRLQRGRVSGVVAGAGALVRGIRATVLVLDGRIGGGTGRERVQLARRVAAGAVGVGSHRQSRCHLGASGPAGSDRWVFGQVLSQSSKGTTAVPRSF